MKEVKQCKKQYQLERKYDSSLRIKNDEIKIIKNEKDKGVCEIANDNADGQVIVSGIKKV